PPVLTGADRVLVLCRGAPSKQWPLPSGEGNHGQRRRRTAARAATPAAGAGGDPPHLRRAGRPNGPPVRADEARGAGAVAAAPAAAGATGGRLVTPRHPGTCPLVVGGRADAAVPRRRPVRLAPQGRGGLGAPGRA